MTPDDYRSQLEILSQHVDTFADQMKRRISDSLAEGKGGWDTMPRTKLLKCLKSEVKELTDALVEGVSHDIVHESVDVANFALFFAAREWSKGQGGAA